MNLVLSPIYLPCRNILSLRWGTISSRKSNFTRFSLLISFSNTDPLKYKEELISECLRRTVMSFLFGLDTLSTSFRLFPLCFISDLFIITCAICSYWQFDDFPISRGIQCATIISRSFRPTFMHDFSTSCTISLFFLCHFYLTRWF